MANKFVIASGKGGVGKTTVTVGISKALTALGKKVLIIDCDRLRSVDLLVGVTKDLVYDFADVILKRCEPNQAVYENEGISVISCPPSYDGITAEDMKALCENYENDFDYIFFDAPAGIDTGITLACANAKDGLVISTPDLVCVRSACTAARHMEKLGTQNTRLIINRVQKKDIKKGRLLNVDSVIDSTAVQLIGVIPEDAKVRLGSMGEAIYKKNQPSYKAFTNISKRICGQYISISL
ncbi:MAG: AAA family ATPase [Acutalibacteraceae bacterium]